MFISPAYAQTAGAAAASPDMLMQMLPLVLIFAGVLGGLFAFGIIGLFVGPVVLAVTYTLLVAWVGQRDGAPPAVKP